MIFYLAVTTDLVANLFTGVRAIDISEATKLLGKAVHSEWYTRIDSNGGYVLLWPEEIHNSSARVFKRTVDCVIIYDQKDEGPTKFLNSEEETLEFLNLFYFASPM